VTTKNARLAFRRQEARFPLRYLRDNCVAAPDERLWADRARDTGIGCVDSLDARQGK
jgi:hypothetical protein